MASMLVILLLGVLEVVYGSRRDRSNELDPFRLLDLPHSLLQPKDYAKLTNKYGEDPKQLQLESFVWKNCGVDIDPIKIDSLSINPDPIQFGKPIKVTASGKLGVDVQSPFEVDVVMQKKVFVWITLPCVERLGSCNYTDVCGMIPSGPCPLPFQQAKLPCHCPFPAGNYTVSDLSVDTNIIKLPDWLSEGEFKAHVVMKQGGKQVGCYDFDMKITGK